MKLTPFCSDSFLLSNEYIISLIALLVVEKFGCDQVPSVARFLITYSKYRFMTIERDASISVDGWRFASGETASEYAAAWRG